MCACLDTYIFSLFIIIVLQLHQEGECPAYPVVCEKCNKDVIPRAKVQLLMTDYDTTF